MFTLTKKMFISSLIATTLIIPQVTSLANAASVSGVPQPSSPKGQTTQFSDDAPNIQSGDVQGLAPKASRSVTIEPYSEKFKGKPSVKISPDATRSDVEKTIEDLVQKETRRVPLTETQQQELKQNLRQAVQDGLTKQSHQNRAFVIHYHEEISIYINGVLVDSYTIDIYIIIF